MHDKNKIHLLDVLLIGGAFTVGFPFAMAVYIRWHRKELYTAKIQSRIGFLYNNYTKKDLETWSNVFPALREQ